MTVTKTWSENQPGRWFVHENKAMVVRVESLPKTWLFTHEFPDGELRSYWSKLVMGPDWAWDESEPEALRLITGWKTAST
jgi:hypothetical protein